MLDHTDCQVLLSWMGKHCQRCLLRGACIHAMSVMKTGANIYLACPGFQEAVLR